MFFLWDLQIDGPDHPFFLAIFIRWWEVGSEAGQVLCKFLLNGEWLTPMGLEGMCPLVS